MRCHGSPINRGAKNYKSDGSKAHYLLFSSSNEGIQNICPWIINYNTFLSRYNIQTILKCVCGCHVGARGNITRATSIGVRPQRARAKPVKTIPLARELFMADVVTRAVSNAALWSPTNAEYALCSLYSEPYCCRHPHLFQSSTFEGHTVSLGKAHCPRNPTSTVGSVSVVLLEKGNSKLMHEPYVQRGGVLDRQAKIEVAGDGQLKIVVSTASINHTSNLIFFLWGYIGECENKSFATFMTPLQFHLIPCTCRKWWTCVNSKWTDVMEEIDLFRERKAIHIRPASYFRERARSINITVTVWPTSDIAFSIPIPA